MSTGDGEDQKMEKKPQRQGYAPSKSSASGTECKKDGYNGGRSGKGNNYSSQRAGHTYGYQGSKQDRCRGYGGRRAVRGENKQPQARGNSALYQGEEVRGDQRAELGSVFNAGSKKNNLSHLLNFSYAPREEENRGHYGSDCYRPRGRKRHAVKFNKEQFLQASCQFVVRDGGDYTAQISDPDTLVDWDTVQQVRVAGNEVPSCPICLYPPVTAKMTRCGHIYCWACMLHYLSLGEKTWRKCPICYEAVHKKDLKSVVAVERPAVVLGEPISFKLMKRERNSAHVMPAEQWSPRIEPHTVTDDVDLCYPKLLLAPQQFVQSMINKERVALETQQAEAGADTLDGSFVQAALDSLKEWELSLTFDPTCTTMQETHPGDFSAAGMVVSESPPVTPLPKPVKGVVEYASAFSDEEISNEEQNSRCSPVENSPDARMDDAEEVDSAMRMAMADCVLTSDSELSTSPREEEELAGDMPAGMQLTPPAAGYACQQRRASNQPVSHFFFYQAADGQHVYLHSINSRSLVAEYGSLEKAPLVITGTVVELEQVSVSEELRNRRRYLAHLPLTCEIQIAEVTLTSPALSEQTRNFFSDEIAKRRHLRQRKEKTETRKLRKLQEEADRRMFGKYPHMRYDISSTAHVPECNSMIVPSAAPTHSSPSFSEDTPAASPAVAVASTSGTDETVNQGSFSFAQMLQHGKAKPSEQLACRKSSSESEPHAAERLGASDESDSEDRAPVYQESLGDAIQRALDNYDKNPGKPQEVKMVTSGGGGKKKKKKKLLFTTTMARGSAD